MDAVQAWLAAPGAAVGVEERPPHTLLAALPSPGVALQWLLSFLAEHSRAVAADRPPGPGPANLRRSPGPGRGDSQPGTADTHLPDRPSASATVAEWRRRLRPLEEGVDREMRWALASQGAVRRALLVLQAVLPESEEPDSGLPGRAAPFLPLVRAPGAPRWLLAHLGLLYPHIVGWALLQPSLGAAAPAPLPEAQADVVTYVAVKVPHAVQAVVRHLVCHSGTPVTAVRGLLTICERTAGLTATWAPLLSSLAEDHDVRPLTTPFEEEDVDQWGSLVKGFVAARWEELSLAVVPFASMLLRYHRACPATEPRGISGLSRRLLDCLNTQLQARLPRLLAAPAPEDAAPPPAGAEAEAVRDFAAGLAADVGLLVRWTIALREEGGPGAAASALLLQDVALAAGLRDPLRTAQQVCHVCHDALRAAATPAQPPAAVCEAALAFYAAYRFHVPLFLPTILLPALQALPSGLPLLTLLLVLERLDGDYSPAYLHPGGLGPAPRRGPPTLSALLLPAPATPHAAVCLRLEEAFVLNGVLRASWLRHADQPPAPRPPPPTPAPELLAVWLHCLRKVKRFMLAEGIEHASFGRHHPALRTNLPGGLDDALALDTTYLLGLASYLLRACMYCTVRGQQRPACRETAALLAQLDTALSLAISLVATTDESEDGGGNVYCLLQRAAKYLFVGPADPAPAEPMAVGNAALPPFAFCPEPPLPSPIPDPAALQRAVYRTVVALCHASANAQTGIPGRAIHMLTSLMVEWTTSPVHPQPPLSKYSELLPNKVPFERDLFLAKLFQSYPTLWALVDLISEDAICFAELLDLVRGLLVLLIGFWHGVAGGPANSSPPDAKEAAQLKHSVCLLKAMARTGFLPCPLSYVHVLLPFCSNAERRTILHEVWNFLLDFAPRKPSQVLQPEHGYDHLLLHPTGAFPPDRNFGLLFHRERQRQRARRAMAGRRGPLWPDRSPADFSEGESDAEGSDVDDADSFGGSDSFLSDDDMEEDEGFASDGGDLDEDGPQDRPGAFADSDPAAPFAPSPGLVITEVKEYPAAAGSGDPPAVGHTEDVEMHDSGDDDDEEEDKQEEDAMHALTAVLCGPQHKGQPPHCPPPDATRFAPPTVDASVLRVYMSPILQILKAHEELTPYLALFYPFGD